MCLIVTNRNLLSRIELWQKKFITQAGFQTDEFMQLGTELEQIAPEEIQRIEQALHGRNDPEAIALKAALSEFEKYNQKHMPDPEKYKIAFGHATRAFPPPSSSLQRLDDHYLLCDLMSQICGAAHLVTTDFRTKLIQSVEKTTVVTAPIGRCNAFAIHETKCGQSGILIDDEILRLSVQLGFLIARLIQHDSRQIIWDTNVAMERLEYEPEITQHYIDTVMSFLVYGTSRLAPPLTISKQGEEVMLLFSQLSIIWCISHEMGHVSLGHFETDKKTMAMLEEIELDSNGVNTEQEIAADTFADAITTSVCEHWALDHTPAYASGAIILSAYQSIYRVISMLHAPELSHAQHAKAVHLYTSHPTPEERLAYRAKTYKKHAFKQKKISNFMQVIFSHLDKHLLAFCNSHQTMKLHPRWNSFLSSLQSIKDGS